MSLLNLSSGLGHHPSREREINVQKSSSVETFPERRHDMPTMAIGASLGLSSPAMMTRIYGERKAKEESC